jgi:DNA-binding transcriptional regulator LsrR (DeoR family)
MNTENNIFEQSLNLIMKAAYLYYHEGIPQKQIADVFEISIPTVSRILRKARERHIVDMVIKQKYLECIKLEETLKKTFSLKDVIIAPVEENCGKDKAKKEVAREGARYIQRVISSKDTIGVAWGVTMHYLINYLNPSQKTNNEFVTLNGNLDKYAKELNSHNLVARLASVFGGTTHCILHEGFQCSVKQADAILKSPEMQCFYKYFDHITISLSGVGSFYPEQDTLLARAEVLKPSELQYLEKLKTYGDIMLRFFDRDGSECMSPLHKRVISIDLPRYRKIHTKILVASGAYKVFTLRAALAGGFADVLIIDLLLAQRLAGLTSPVHT